MASAVTPSAGLAFGCCVSKLSLCLSFFFCLLFFLFLFSIGLSAAMLSSLMADGGLGVDDPPGTERI